MGQVNLTMDTETDGGYSRYLLAVTATVVAIVVAACSGVGSTDAAPSVVTRPAPTSHAYTNTEGRW